ncbi:MAG TPA: HNH endonuclease [Alphaproteobacteria bacterium]|nr:HNH endonuclease [Alphaproteobacteria bacterium]
MSNPYLKEQIMASRKKHSYSDYVNNIRADKFKGNLQSFFGLIRSAEYLEQLPQNPLDFDDEINKFKHSLECVYCKNRIDATDQLPGDSVIYCSEYCQQIAGTIRYVRKGIANERVFHLDFQIGLKDRLMHLPSGGYLTRERIVPKHVRIMIFNRDSHTCVMCHKEPAKHINHIRGPSGDPSNLQALCAKCHRIKTTSSLRPATEEERSRILALYQSMAVHIAMSTPYQACEDYERWQKSEPRIRSARKKMVAEIIQENEDSDDANWEDADGYVAHTLAKDD